MAYRGSIDLGVRVTLVAYSYGLCGDRLFLIDSFPVYTNVTHVLYCTCIERTSVSPSCRAQRPELPGRERVLTPCWILSFARPSTLRLFYGPHLCMAHGFNIFVDTPTLGVLPGICQAER